MNYATRSHPRLTWLWGILFLLSLSWLIWQQIWLAQPVGVGSLPFKNVIPKLFEATFYVASFFALRSWLRSISFYNTEENLATVAASGLAVLAVAVIPDLLGWLGQPLAANGSTAILLDGLRFVLTTLFFIVGLLLLLRFNQQYAGKSARKLQPFFIATIVTGALLQTFFTLPPAANLFFYILAGALAMAMIYRTTWITYINRKSRIATFTYLLAITFIAGALFLKTIYQPAITSTLTPMDQSLFLHLTGGFILTFGGWSALVLFFHLPIASVLDARQKENDHLLQVSALAEERKEVKSLMNTLLKRALDNNSATTAWISKVQSSEPDNEVEVMEGISDNDRKRIEYTMHAHPAHFELDSASRFIYIRDASEDPYLTQHTLEVQSLAVFPFVLGNGEEWRLHIGSDEVNGFNEPQLEQLAVYVTHTRLSVNNVTMLESALEKEELRKDLEVGQQVQKRLLPEYFPQNRKVDISAASLAAEEVGGDYYDCHPLDDGRLALLMADVSGKGTSAAYHVAEMKGIFKSLMLSEPRPSDFLINANKAVAHCFDKGMFITLIYAVIDFEKNQMRYARGGHCPVLHYNAKANKIRVIEDEGLGLGIVRDKSYDDTVKEHRLTTHPGDLLVFYTDGIVEARNPETKVEYGYQRLRDCVYLNLELPAKNLTSKIIQDVQQYTHGEASRDDMSVMVVRMA